MQLDDFADLLHEERIGRDLKMALTMRLKVKSIRNPLYIGLGEGGFFCRGAGGPVGAAPGVFPEGSCEPVRPPVRLIWTKVALDAVHHEDR